MRIALFTLESLASAVPVRRFIAEHADRIAFVGLSDPYRPAAGGQLGQTLRHLRRSGIRFVPYLLTNFAIPQAVISVPWRRKGTGVDSIGISRLCSELALPCFKIADVNGSELAGVLGALKPDLILSYHFDQIFSEATLRLAPLGGINVHPSLLPRHRGPVPTLYAALDQPPRYGVTIHRLVARIDAGAILRQQVISYMPGLSVLAMATHLHEVARPLLAELLRKPDLLANLEGTEPDRLPYCPFPSPETLREASRRGIDLVNRHDLLAALRL